ncbi:cytochrome P450 724B1-like [Euphorbia lathyris]|uniref:cytochrome P450 724B1-like n=1 Tax=Euphorbia lathyris TaxID=212925 RepID=UPI003313F180
MDTILVMVIGLLPIVSAVIVFASNSSKTKNNINLPNGNMGWPIIGQTLSFLKAHRSTSMANFLEDQCSRYGKVFKCHLFGSATIVSCDYELNLFILQNKEKLFPASYPKAMEGILGTSSLLMTFGELYRKLRDIVVSFSAMSKSNPSFLHSLQNIALSMMDSWKDYKEIAFRKQVKKFALDLMLKTLLSIEPEEPLALKILQDFLTYMKGFVSLPVEFFKNKQQARARLSSTVGEIIKGREEEKRRKGDFLEVILSKGGVSDEEKVSTVLDILLAGYETSSTLISLIVYFLGHSPLAFQSFKKEHQSIRKSKAQQDKYLDFKDYQKMEFTQNVINEAMRCGNIVKFVHRKATQDVKCKGVIPSGWKALPILAAAHFDTSLPQNPFDFDPWRWTNSKKVIIPFGGGPRLCPGAELAKVETAFFLHHIVLNYRCKVKPDDFPMAYPYVEFQQGLCWKLKWNIFSISPLPF